MTTLFRAAYLVTRTLVLPYYRGSTRTVPHMNSKASSLFNKNTRWKRTVETRGQHARREAALDTAHRSQ